MSFLSIAFLTALPLAAAPVLLHLFDRRRSVVIEWGAMQFLQEAARRKTSSRKLQHWLLLLLRVGTVAALILALARPLVPGHMFGGSRPGETILVIDNSLSTQQKSADATAFEHLLERAKQIVEQQPSNREVRVLVTSPYPAWGTETARGGTSAGLQALEAVRTTPAEGDLLAALMKAVQSTPEDAMLAERRIVVLTDGQRSAWRTQDVSGWARLRRLLEEAHVPTRVEIDAGDVDPGEMENISVEGVRSQQTVVGVGQPLSLTATLRNYGAKPSPAGRLKWMVNGETQSEVPFPELAAGETRDVTWTHAFGVTGESTIDCRLAVHDVLEGDNSESLVVEVVDRVPILLVESADELAEIQQDAYLIQAALGRVEGDASAGWQAVYDPRVVSPDSLERLPLGEYRAVVIPSLRQLSGRAVEQLADYVATGGGLWIALGPRADVPAFNAAFYLGGAGLSPLMIGEAVDERDGGSRRTTIHPFRSDHPATRALTGRDGLDTGDVEVTRRFPFEMADEQTDVSVLLELTNGDPLAVENRFGRGRVIVQGIPLKFQWSRLAASQAFVVMVHDWLGYLCEPGGTRHNLQPGEPLVARTEARDQTDAVLSLPHGEDIVISGEPVEEGLEFRTSRTMIPGRYRLEFGVAGDGVSFHVSRPLAESRLERLTSEDRAFLSEAVGLGSLGGQAFAGNGRTQPIWPALLVLAIVLMTCELLLSGAMARTRFGMDAISETAEDWATGVGRSPQGGGPPAVQPEPSEVRPRSRVVEPDAASTPSHAPVT